MADGSRASSHDGDGNAGETNGDRDTRRGKGDTQESHDGACTDGAGAHNRITALNRATRARLGGGGGDGNSDGGGGGNVEVSGGSKDGEGREEGEVGESHIDCL